MFKIPVILKEDYIVFMEPSLHGPLVHCDIKTSWSKSVRQALIDDWRTLQNLHGYNRMFAVHKEHQGNKHVKFLELMGFRYVRNLSSGDELWAINLGV